MNRFAVTVYIICRKMPVYDESALARQVCRARARLKLIEFLRFHDRRFTFTGDGLTVRRPYWETASTLTVILVETPSKSLSSTS